MAKKKKEVSWKDHSAQELEVLARDLARDIFMLRNELAVNRKLEKPHQLKAKKKERARVLTLMTQKQQDSSLKKGA